MLLAESDRDVYRREQAALAREKEIMKDVPGWEVSHKCPNSNSRVRTTSCEERIEKLTSHSNRQERVHTTRSVTNQTLSSSSSHTAPISIVLPLFPDLFTYSLLLFLSSQREYLSLSLSQSSLLRESQHNKSEIYNNTQNRRSIYLSPPETSLKISSTTHFNPSTSS